MDLKDLLSIVPDLINLFLPGFIYMRIHYWIKNRPAGENTLSFILWSIFITVLINTVCSTIHIFVLSSYNFPEPFKVFIYAVIASVSPIIWEKISKTKRVSQILHFTTEKSIYDDIFDNLIDYTGCAIRLRIYLKDYPYFYVGQFATREEKGNDSWIALMDYCLVDKTDNQIIDIPMERDEKSMAMMRISDVERIELIYEDDSPTWKKFHPW